MFWFSGAHPSVAVETKLRPAAESGFAPMAVFIPIGNPADAIEVESRPHSGRSIYNSVIRFNFGPELLTIQDFDKSFDYGSLNIDREIITHEDLSSNLDVPGGGFSNVESKYRSPDENILFNLPARDLDNMDDDLGAMRGNEFFAPKLDLAIARAAKGDGSDPQTYGREGQYQIEQSDRIARHLLPKGFTFVCLVSGFLGGLVTLFLLSFGR
jgi:hypothetical protein